MPLVTVMLAVFSAFPMFAKLQDTLQSYFLQTLVPDNIARPVLGAITQFSSRASRLGIVGLVALVVSALAMMLTIDRALNAIWRVRKPRRIAQRVLVYWGAVTLGPLIFAVSLTATSYAVSASRGLFGDMPSGFGVLVGAIEFVVHAIGIAALFHFVPNTYVRWRHALLGGVFVAVFMAGGKRALTYYFGAVPTYSMIYGAFATVPIFLVWIYLELGRGAARRGDRRLRAAGRQAHDALARRAGHGVPPRAGGSRPAGRGAPGREARPSVQAIAEAINIDPLQIDAVISALVDIDWVGRLDEHGDARYVLLVDPATTTVEPLVARLLLDPTPDLAPVWKRAGFGQLRLAEILAAPGASA